MGLAGGYGDYNVPSSSRYYVSTYHLNAFLLEIIPSFPFKKLCLAVCDVSFIPTCTEQK